MSIGDGTNYIDLEIVMLEPSEKLLNSNVEIFTTIFAAIWQRKPIIFASQSNNENFSLLETLFTFFPEHRQLIIVGETSNRVFYRFRTAKHIDSSDIKSRNESILNCFGEDGISSPPIQLLYINANNEDFLHTLHGLKFGWIATTSESSASIFECFEKQNCIKIKLKDVEIIFPFGCPEKMSLERKVSHKCLNRSFSVRQFIVQMKMSEVRFVCKAILQEIEKGNHINQAQTEEQFSIERLTFEQAIRLLQVENHINPIPYVQMASEAVTRLLHEIHQFNGVTAAAAIKNKTIIALEKKKNDPTLSSDLFVPIADFLQEPSNFDLLGENLSLILKLENDYKLYYTCRYFSPEQDEICLAFFLDASQQLAVLNEKIDDLLKHYE